MKRVLVTVMNAIVFAALTLDAFSAPIARRPARMPGNNSGERFPALTLAPGQGIRALVSNVRIVEPGAVSTACSVAVGFFGADGAAIGAEQMVQLTPGASATVGPGQTMGLVRVIVRIADAADPESLCAIRSLVEIFNLDTGATLFPVSSNSCLGRAPCATPLASAPDDENGDQK